MSPTKPPYRSSITRGQLTIGLGKGLLHVFQQSIIIFNTGSSIKEDGKQKTK